MDSAVEWMHEPFSYILLPILEISIESAHAQSSFVGLREHEDEGWFEDCCCECLVAGAHGVP